MGEPRLQTLSGQWYVRLLGALATVVTYAAWCGCRPQPGCERPSLQHSILWYTLSCLLVMLRQVSARSARWSPLRAAWVQAVVAAAHQGPALLPGAAPSGHAETPSEWLVDAQGTPETRWELTLCPPQSVRVCVCVCAYECACFVLAVALTCTPPTASSTLLRVTTAACYPHHPLLR